MDEELISTVEEEIEETETPDVLEEAIHDAMVMHVNIDDTLSISGQAADAKATGDALAEKLSETDLKNAYTINGKTSGSGWSIILNGDDIPAQSNSDPETIADALSRIDTSNQGKADISDVKGTLSVAGRNGNGTWNIPLNGTDIPLTSDADEESVSEAVSRLEGADEDLDERIDDLEAQQGFAVTLEFTTTGTQTVSDSRITADHDLTGYQFFDSSDAETAVILADFSWETSTGALTVVFDAVRASGSVRLNFGWREEVTVE